MSIRNKSRVSRFSFYQDPEDLYRKRYLAMSVQLGMIDTSVDPFADPFTNTTSSQQLSLDVGYAKEGLADTLTMFAGMALKYMGDGLMSLGDSAFTFIRFKAEKSMMAYPALVNTWKARVWKNARDIDGRKFDAYKCNVVPHAGLIKRIQAVESIHKILSDVNKIYNAPVPKNSDSWTTPECEKAISLLSTIGAGSKNMDSDDTLSKQYMSARKNQPLYLHGYTPKRILDLMTRCEKLAEYGSPKYISEFRKKYLGTVADLDSFESETSEKEADFDTSEEGNATPSQQKLIDERNHESKIRSTRLWWMAHFIKFAYIVTGDIIKDLETLSRATESCLAKDTQY